MIFSARYTQIPMENYFWFSIGMFLVADSGVEAWMETGSVCDSVN